MGASEGKMKSALILSIAVALLVIHAEASASKEEMRANWNDLKQTIQTEATKIGATIREWMKEFFEKDQLGDHFEKIVIIMLRRTNAGLKDAAKKWAMNY